MIIILTGVSGAGKTTVGELLAKEIGCEFYEGDNFHSESNVEKMSQNIPLRDEDREPWLAGIKGFIEKLQSENKTAIISCSALKIKYREYLKAEIENICFILLNGDYDLINNRIKERKNHFMKDNLLKSQFEILETSDDLNYVDVGKSPDEIVSSIKTMLISKMNFK